MEYLIIFWESLFVLSYGSRLARPWSYLSMSDIHESPYLSEATSYPVTPLGASMNEFSSQSYDWWMMTSSSASFRRIAATCNAYMYDDPNVHLVRVVCHPACCTLHLLRGHTHTILAPSYLPPRVGGLIRQKRIIIFCKFVNEFPKYLLYIWYI